MEFPQNSRQVAVPPEPHPKYPLGQLPDPPDEYIFLGRPYGVIIRSRGQSLAELKVFARYWLWGFEYGEDKRFTILAALGKVNYWMRPEYQFHTEADMCDVERDGGPRLLQYTIIPTPSPVSRHYPKYLTDDEMLQLGAQNYIRPADAPQHVPDTLMFQFLLPARVSTSQFVSHLLPTGVFTGVTIDQRPEMTSAIMENLPNRTQNSSVLTQARHTYQSGFNFNAVREAIEKALIKLCYKDLERHHHAPSKEPVATRVASTHADLSVVQVGTHTTVSELRLDPDTHQFNESGFPYPYRGRGPVWADGSCAIDTAIVLGMLTMAGCTNIDRPPGKEETFNEIEKAFIQVTNMNWDAFDNKVSIELRHSFYNLLCDNVPDIKRDKPVPIWAAWAESTRAFGQFQIVYTETPAGPCPQCGYSENHHVQRVGNCIIPPGEDSDKNGVQMSTLIDRAWSTAPVHYGCMNCSAPAGPLRLRHVSQLPLRLVVNVNGRNRTLNHTQDQRLQYLDIDGNTQTAHYRWLGGAYYKDNHVRVYWTDAERGEFDIGNIRKYDGEDAGGVIIGGIAPYAPDDRVPLDWVSDGLPLAIYERIINPTPDMLHAATQTICDISDCVGQDKPFLAQHFPWFPKSMERKSPYLPLERVLPDTGERYYEKNLVLSSDTLPDITLDLNNTIADQLAEWTMQTAPHDPMQTAPDDPMQDPDPNLIGIDPGLLERIASGETLFNSYNSDPTTLMNHPEMWPAGGMPGVGGATTFPNLPKTPTGPGGGSRSPYWNWVNLSPGKQFGANGKADDGEEMVTVVKIRHDCRVGPSPYRLYRIPVKSIKAAMRRMSLKQIESQSPEKQKKEKEKKKKQPRVEELKDEEPRTAKRTKRNGVK
ncbi:uncharacterized protein N7496_002176 [Penicillium cataractarum]|uniref:Uncharacterized protein n=1 Tax=Penicillium cataractarum TaxID=2100454 RepID=A0A9W9VF22_9EURO|nr:uncharacterized protein N7496_002176 [Penicillium cataractarum]KAJ5379748.1 hypothetical protein N7496_002176 [Penicillium cataractarum]